MARTLTLTLFSNWLTVSFIKTENKRIQSYNSGASALARQRSSIAVVIGLSVVQFPILIH